MPGITEAVHALKHAKWLAGCAIFRGAERSVTTSWDGRLIYPGDHILSDMWFLKQTTAYGVASYSGSRPRRGAEAWECSRPCGIGLWGAAPPSQQSSGGSARRLLSSARPRAG
ncbi:hypothetical protein MGN01_30970 [Methylobacterium gnaphalii]|uniref:Uncharacterized protein n=1 Tax=Methylobacterium gnaphalii TaxID=1010610 RepID=A0A512JMU7_9HYPH|nr:hypothetical protein MGN01_30970 [Methylobacterium gnaphalii]GLS49952.1 hypothetical protein GCM10007885_28040 [Methylobacterium gnaphalii]